MVACYEAIGASPPSLRAVRMSILRFGVENKRGAEGGGSFILREREGLSF